MQIVIHYKRENIRRNEVKIFNFQFISPYILSHLSQLWLIIAFLELEPGTIAYKKSITVSTKTHSCP